MYYVAMETIINELTLDFTFNDDPVIINKGILDTIDSIDQSNLSISLALFKIKSEKLYIKLGFSKMSKYIKNLVEKSNKDRSSIYNWLQIGEMYIKYRKELEKAGYTSKNGLTKLLYLERALEEYPKRDVFNKIISMTQREFANYARLTPEVNEKIEKYTRGETKVRRNKKNHRFIYRGIEAAILNRDIGSKAFEWAALALRTIFYALHKNNSVIIVKLKTELEYRKLLPVIKNTRKAIKNEMKENEGMKEKGFPDIIQI